MGQRLDPFWGAPLARLHRRSSSLKPGAFGWDTIQLHRCSGCRCTAGRPDMGLVFSPNAGSAQFERRRPVAPLQERAAAVPIENLLQANAAWLKSAMAPCRAWFTANPLGRSMLRCWPGSEGLAPGASLRAVFDPAVYRR